MAPRVTVIMPTYNWSSVLPYSIASTLEQSFTDFELLVIGDGCTDDSERVVNGIGDPRVRWIGLPRSGHQSGPNNEGIRQARGEYVAYQGHDDLWLRHHLAVLVPALDAGADLAHSVVAMVRADGSVYPWTPVPSSVAHRRSMTDRIGGWRDYREIAAMPEVDLFDRARAAGMAFSFVRRLSVIKPAASWRRGIYRERPCHEQAAWLERIRTEPDLETTELVDAAFALMKPPSVPDRLARLLIRPWTWPRVVWDRLPLRKGELVGKMRRAKGIRD
jgi:glycosyltransferase involved in cell wall biosynthesis